MSDRGPLLVNWSELINLITYGSLQTNIPPDANFDRFVSTFSSYHRHMWHQRYGSGAYDLPDSPMIIDIGCGSAVVDILLSQYIPNSRFHLIDGDGISHDRRPIYTNDGSVIYNSLSLIKDSILSSGADPNRFTFNEMGLDPWPKADLIMSTSSWCYHYPTEIYLDKVMQSLKPGGKLWVSILHQPDDDSITKISRAIGARPKSMVPYDIAYKPSHIPLPNDLDVWKWDCLWEKP